MEDDRAIPEAELQAWAGFRYQVRVWGRIAEQAAREVGLAPQHQQVLLAIRGFPGGDHPRIIDLAEQMQLQHHSMVGLLDRMQHEGLIKREHRPDGRGVSVVITPDGDLKLDAAIAILRPKLRAAAVDLVASLSQLLGEATGAVPAPPAAPAATGAAQ